MNQCTLKSVRGIPSQGLLSFAYPLSIAVTVTCSGASVFAALQYKVCHILCTFFCRLRLSFATFSAEHRWSFLIDVSRKTSISCPKAEECPNIWVGFLQWCPTLTSTVDFNLSF